MWTDSPNASAPELAPPHASGRAPRLTRQQFNRQLWWAIIPPLLLLTLHAAVITLLFLYFLQATGWARQTEQTLGAINDVERLLVNMETAIRGRLLTGDDSFVSPYLRAQPRVEPAFERLRRLIADDPAQIARLDAIEKSYRDWLVAEKALPTRAIGAAIPPQTYAVIMERKELIDGIRDRVREMSMAGLEQQRTRYDREERAATLALLGGVGVSVLLGIGLALVNRRTVLRLSGMYQQAIEDEASSARQFIDLAETVPQLIWIADGVGKPTYFNRPWSDVTGRSREELAATGWLGALHPDDAGAATAKWEQSASTGTPFEGEYRLRDSAGEYRWFLCRAIPVRDAEGRRTRWFGSCTDIESQKQVTRERERALAIERAARSDLLRQSRTKDEFLATLSHELRTPMTAILGWARLLRDPTVRDANLDRAIEAIDANARAQARLIDDLLDMSRINAGKLSLRMEPVDLLAVTRSAMDAVGPAAANRKVALTLAVGNDGEIRLTGDAARLQQVVWNLLSNAVKFTPSGGRVSVEIAAVDSTARITVSDTGQGIDPAFLPHVFQRFRQADGSTTRHHGGLGLGLAIAQHLVEMHGGRVWAESDGLGRGARFTVELPIRIQEVTAPQCPAPAANDGIEGRCILIVDDDASSTAMLKVALQRAGCRVEAVNAATEALRLLREQRFDLLVSDIGMPDMDGYALIRRIRRDEPPGRAPMPAIALTAFARTEDRSAALDAGFDAHVAKPVTPEQLVAAIISLLEQSTRG